MKRLFFAAIALAALGGSAFAQTTAAGSGSLPPIITTGPVLPVSPFPAKALAPIKLPVYPILNGFLVGAYTEAGVGSVVASAPGVPPASLSTTSAAVGLTVGYMYTPRNSPFGYSVEGDVCAMNYNGNTQGFSVQGPVCFEGRVMVWGPWQTIQAWVSSVIPVPNPFSGISAFSFAPGVTPVGNTLAGIGGGFYGRDISTAFAGVQAGKIIRINPELVVEIRQPQSNGTALLGFIKTDFNSQSQIIGAVPKGSTFATLGEVSVRAGGGIAF